MLPLLTIVIPGSQGRCDLHPAEMWWWRLRHYAVEVLLVVLFCSEALNTSDSWKVAQWMNVWSLLAYCIHAALAWNVPSPYGAVITYLLGVPIWRLVRVLERRNATCRNTDQQEDITKDSDSRCVVLVDLRSAA